MLTIVLTYENIHFSVRAPNNAKEKERPVKPTKHLTGPRICLGECFILVAIGFHRALQCLGQVQLILLIFLRDNSASGTARSTPEVELPT